MAFETGTASSYIDLLDKLKTFATATLPVGQRWTVLRDAGTPRELVLQGPGLAGADDVNVGIKLSAGADYGNWIVKGFTSWNSGLTWSTQANASADCFALFLNAPMTYWLVGNGRRLVVVAKAGLYYHCCYLGFFLPYGSPGQYAYPMVIGQSSLSGDVRYSIGGTAFPLGNGLVWILGAWRNLMDSGSVSLNTLRELPGGGYLLYPVWAMDSTNQRRVGELDGVFRLAGYNQNPENLVTVGGVDHVVFPNINASGRASMWALRME